MGSSCGTRALVTDHGHRISSAQEHGPDRLWLNTVYPSITFGLWHLCPLSVLSSRYPGGTISFAAYSIALGLSYAYYARSTGSIRWCIVSHCIHDALGLGAFAYSQWLM